MSTPSLYKIAGLSEALVGFPDKLLMVESHSGADITFMGIRLSMRDFVHASKQLSEIVEVNYEDGAGRHFDNLKRSIMLWLADLRWAYLRRGRSREWARLSYWLWKVRRLTGQR